MRMEEGDIMSSVDFVKAEVTESGDPKLFLMCDCGMMTAVTVHMAEPTLEFAYTCDSCMEIHWAVIKKVT